jgi:excisionase family DNA binding protein
MTELLTIPEVAARLRISERKLFYLIAKGTIRTVHIDRRTLITERELRAYVAYLESRAA